MDYLSNCQKNFRPSRDGFLKELSKIGNPTWYSILLFLFVFSVLDVFVIRSPQRGCNVEFTPKQAFLEAPLS